MPFVRMFLGLGALAAATCAALGADLPGGKSPGAPAVAACHVGGMEGVRLPGSDVCLRIGGFIDSQMTAGTLGPQFGLIFTGAPGASPVTVAALNPPAARDGFGLATRAQLDVDLRETTPYGVLRGYAEWLLSNGTGFDNPGDAAVLNVGYIQFGGVTAGRVGSFFAFLAGGATWYDVFSPDRVNGNQPELIAYSLPLGTGWTATLSLEDPAGAVVNNGIDGGFANAVEGTRYPDVVVALRVEQAWGAAQFAAVAHNSDFTGVSLDTLNRWGGAGLIGAVFNLPQVAAGDRLGAQVVYSVGALGYSGLPNTAQSPFDEGLNMNGNGAIFQLADALNADVGVWSIPRAWSAAAFFEHHVSPQVWLTPEISVANIAYSGSPSMISANATSAIAGAVAHWSPVPHLDFQIEAMYQTTWQAAPSNYVGPQAFPARSSAFSAALAIVRDF